jgi:DNA-binding transcriptional LysR family regulator
MNAPTQYRFSASDLEVILALTRGATLAVAAARLGVDASTVFRSVQRIERELGHTLFERSRRGYLPSELALKLAEHGEQMEIALEAARAETEPGSTAVTGQVKITTTDTVLHGLLAPALKHLHRDHPQLRFELSSGNELANLTRRDADIAVRATKRPPQHLVGKHLGPIRVALFAGAASGVTRLEDIVAAGTPWIAPDDALPEHPSVLWRKKHFPKVLPGYRVNSIQSVFELIGRGLGVGIVPLFLAKGRAELVPLTAALDEAQTELWLLTHTESRHLRRVATVFGHLAHSIALD